jgi:hypothetical protein
VRKGSDKTVGKPVKEFDPSRIGIKVVKTDVLDPNYLYYAMMNLHNQGHFARIANGTTNLVNIRVEDIANIPLGQQDMTEESKGLWANIHAKQNRIKHGSGERMRKPGSKGAPSAQNFKDAANEAANPAQQAAIAINMKKRHQKPAGVAEATGDPKFDTMMNRMTTEPKYPDKKVLPTSIPELIQWAEKNNKPDHWHFAQWANKNKFTNVNDALEWFGDNVDPTNEWGPKEPDSPWDGEWLEDAAKHDPKAAELLRIYNCYERIVFDWSDDYRQMNMPDPFKDKDLEEGETWSKHNNPRAGGMSKKSVSSYRRSHPGSKIQTAVTTKPSKLKKGSKAAKRRKSFCARMKGMKKSRTSAKTARDPNSNINKSLRRWNCESIEQMEELLMLAEQMVAKARKEIL